LTPANKPFAINFQEIIVFISVHECNSKRLVKDLGDNSGLSVATRVFLLQLGFPNHTILFPTGNPNVEARRHREPFCLY